MPHALIYDSGFIFSKDCGWVDQVCLNNYCSEEYTYNTVYS